MDSLALVAMTLNYRQWKERAQGSLLDRIGRCVWQANESEVKELLAE